MKDKRRQSNIESLRVAAMMMVVAMHYLMKGGALIPLEEQQTFVSLIGWGLEAACIVAVNVYVLISGYFLPASNWRIGKVVELWAQVMWYSVGISILCLFLGIGDVPSWDIYDWAAAVFPLQMEHYWFATAYMIMYLFSPLINKAIHHLEKKQLEQIILLLLFFFSIIKSILPIHIPTDKYGYDFGWFLCLYLIGGYIRLYGLKQLTRIRRGLLLYLGGVAAILCYSVLLGFLCRKGLPLGYAMDMTYSYNHVFVLAASVGLFVGVNYMHFPDSKLGNLCVKIAPYTFGVYLLHEHTAVRSLWPGWMGIEAVKGSILMLPHLLFSVVVVFTIGIVTDYVRSIIFRYVKSLPKL